MVFTKGGFSTLIIMAVVGGLIALLTGGYVVLQQFQSGSEKLLSMETGKTTAGLDFFPIGLYCVEDFYPPSPGDPPSKITVLEEFPRIAQAGFNVIQSYRFDVASPEWGNTNEKAREFLDAAQRNNLKVLIGLTYEDWVWQGKLDRILERVRALKDHPALYGWILNDDTPQGFTPDEGGTTTEEFAELLLKIRRTIKEVDPHHPLVVALPGYVDENYEFRNVADIYMPDNAPVGFEVIPPGLPPEWESHLEDVGKFIDQIYNAIGPNQAVISHIQTYNLANDAPTWDRMPREYGRYPSRDEMRFMTYNALIHGSQGVFFLCYRFNYRSYGAQEGYDGGDDISPKGNRKQWESVSGIASELRSFSPILITPSLRPEDAGVRLVGGTPVEMMAKRYAGKTYLFTANPISAKVKASIHLSPEKFPRPEVRPFFGLVAVNPLSGRDTSSWQWDNRDSVPLSLEWEPYRVEIYEISDTTIPSTTE